MDNLEIKAMLEKVINNIEALPAMPPLVQKLETMISDPDVDVNLLSKELSMDPALTASLIRLSNSAYYGPSRKIRSVTEAIMTLGLAKVRDIVLVVAANGIIKVNLDSFRLSSGEVWDHSLLVAEVASLISSDDQISVRPDIAFTAGLLHDVGKILISQFFHCEYKSIQLAMRDNPDRDFLALEEEHLGFTHSEAGARLLEVWNFPEELVEAVRHTYMPQKATLNPELSSLVHIANAIVLSAGVGIDIGGLNVPLSDYAIAVLNLDNEKLQEYYAAVPDLIEKLSDLRFFQSSDI